MDVSIVGCRFHDNEVLDGDGAGIYCVGQLATFRIDGCRICSSAIHDHGGGIYGSSVQADGAAFGIRNNILWGNPARTIPAAGESGGGL